MLLELYALVGRAANTVLLPATRFFIRRTHRAYALLVCGEKVLVVKNWLGDKYWQLPGGGIRSNESAKRAVVREVKEELGIALKRADLDFLTQGLWQTHKLRHHYTILIAYIKDRPSINRRAYEIVDAKWLSPNQLNSKNTSAEILYALDVAGLKAN